MDDTSACELLRYAGALVRPPHLSTALGSRAVGPYRGYAELVDEWCSLCSGGVRPRVVGKSVRGAPLIALELGPPDAKRVSVVMAGIHPTEWIGVEVMMGLLTRLVAAPVHDRRVLAFPLVNVDGYRAVEHDLRTGRKRWHRTNARGVDLNRNWPTHYRPGRQRPRVLRGYNHGGTHATSEPEVACVVKTLDAVSREATIDIALSLHSIGQMVLVPYGGIWRRPASYKQLRRAAERVRSRLAPRYTVTQSARWVPGAFARGMEIDHLYEAYGAMALLVECTYGGASLLEPSSLSDPFRLFNPRAPHKAVAALAPALESFLRGNL